MMLKALLKVRLAAFGAYFTGASRSRRRQSKVQKIGMLAVMLYALAAFGMLFYTSFSAIAGIYAHEGFGWLYFAMYAIMAFALMVFGASLPRRRSSMRRRTTSCFYPCRLPRARFWRAGWRRCGF